MAIMLIVVRYSVLYKLLGCYCKFIQYGIGVSELAKP